MNIGAVQGFRGVTTVKFAADSGAREIKPLHSWSDYYGGPNIAKTVVARTQQEAEKLFAENYDTNVYRPKGQPQVAPVPPEFDSNKHMLVGIFLGTRSSGGYGIEVPTINETKDKIEVGYREVRPGGGFVTMALTTPGVILLLPKSEKPVEFKQLPSKTR